MKWYELVALVLGTGGVAGIAPAMTNWMIGAKRSAAVLHAADLKSDGQFRQDLIRQVGELQGRVDTIRGQVDEWQQKYFDVASQNEILKHQVEALVDQNENLKKMVALLEDENQALKKELDALR